MRFAILETHSRKIVQGVDTKPILEHPPNFMQLTIH
jgi:hypothetical protein